MKFSAKKLFLLSLIFLLTSFILTRQAEAQAEADASLDSDRDGFCDEVEIKNGYSPFNAGKVKLDKNDADQDGLSDYWELKFETDPLKADTDGDGFKDGEEVDRGFDPLAPDGTRLAQKIEINLKDQKLDYLVGGQIWKQFTVSTGKASMPTPKGSFAIINKSKKAWSKAYGLWMPYWLGLDHGEFGIHELPIWPGGYREGENHLGHPVSHGCVRLGIGSAQYIYDRVATGTKVEIK